MKVIRIRKIVLIVSLIMTCNAIFGQISQGGLPYSFSTNLKKPTGASVILSKNIPTIKMSKIDNGIIEEIKQSNEIQEGNYQFAYSFNVDINIKTSSIIDSLDFGLLYRISINSVHAYSINLIFKKYILPKGAKLFIYSLDKEYIIGAFTSNNNKICGRLPTLPVRGDEIIVEYFEPYYTEFTGELVVGVVNHDFIGAVSEGSIEDDFGSSGSCMVDINCSEGNNWQTEKRAVCRIVKDGNSHCTGTLLNNTNNDGRPYFLTANHCISTQSEADDCIFIFNYESLSCGGGDGSTSQSIAGATLRATRQQSDFVLLEFSHEPLSSWNPYYAGWDRNDNQGAGGVGIHHPAGDVKKISTYNMTPINSNCISGFPQNNFYLINNWTSTANGHGVTEGGSSGSALFNNNHQVIGQLYGGCSGHNSNCSDPTNDFSNYGKIFASWDLGGSANNQLQNWLDPSNGLITVLNGANVCPQGTVEHLNITHTINSGVVEIHQATKTITASNTIKSGATVTYEAGESITLEPGFVAEAGSNFTAQIKSFDCVPGCHPVSIDLLPNVFTPNGDGINDNLCYPVTNATSYEFEAYNRWGTRVFSSSGSVSGNMACVWDGTGSCGGCWYAVIITFSNECDEKSEAYGVTVFGSGNKSAKYSESSNSDSTDTKDKLLLNISFEQESQNLDFEVFPNPTDGNFSLEIKSTNSYSFEIINSVGVLMYKIDKLNNHKIEINKTGFASGFYYIRLNDENSVVTKKIIIH
ncbi:MAG: gliding motility-associated C-terminal domain-containing protein [Bacteroidales bacterium]|nr:gliding motility-associated C-terminal domain-containing protein [Bacteroidales bacterium]